MCILLVEIWNIGLCVEGVNSKHARWFFNGILNAWLKTFYILKQEKKIRAIKLHDLYHFNRWNKLFLKGIIHNEFAHMLYKV